MFVVVPYRVDVAMPRWPYANFAILGLLVVVFLVEQGVGEKALEPYFLLDLAPRGLLAHMWLHAGLLHLLGNLLFLWVFGNAVCARMGNVRYALIYVFLGLLAGLTHALCDQAPAIGASGAINGVVGIFLVLYPQNATSCVWCLFFPLRGGQFSVSSCWLILLWFGFDLLGAYLGISGIAYYAHLGGFAAGALSALLLLRLGVIEMDRADRTLLDIFFPPRHPAA